MTRTRATAIARRLLPALLLSVWLGLGLAPAALAAVTPAKSSITIPENPASAQIQVGETVKSGDQPFKPNLAIDIPNVTFSDVQVSELGGGIKIIDIPWLAQYIEGVYKYAIGIGVFLAGVMIMVSGVIYLTAGDSRRVGRAKEMMTDAILGLAIMLGSFVLLNTLSPNLTELNSLRVRILAPETFSVAEVQDEADAAYSKSVPGGTVCSTPQSCTEWCLTNTDPTQWPTSTNVTLDFNTLQTIQARPGLQVSARQDASRATQQTIAALYRAADIAVRKDPSYRIVLVSASRSLATQIKLACDKVKEGKADDLGRLVAFPGGSNHGKGIAVDIWLEGGGKALSVIGSKLQTDIKYRTGSQMLDQIMTEAGFKRYSAEMWHFEFGGGSGCRCTAPNCPWPPSC